MSLFQLIIFVSSSIFVTGMANAESIQLCNQSDEHVYAAMMWQENDTFLSKGWFSIEEGSCISAQVGNEIVWIYGEGDNERFWAGTQGMCVQSGAAFDFTDANTQCNGHEDKFFAWGTQVDLSSSNQFLFQNSKSQRGLSFCNETDQKLFTTVAFDNLQGIPIHKGWYSVDAGACRRMWFPTHSDEIQIYAQAGSHVWKSNGPALCRNRTQGFSFQNPATIACSDEGLVKEATTRIAFDPVSKLFLYNFNVQNAARSAIKICNQIDEKVWYNLLYRARGNNDLSLRGWFWLEPNTCKSFWDIPHLEEAWLYGSTSMSRRVWSGPFHACVDVYQAQTFTDPVDMECKYWGQVRKGFQKLAVDDAGRTDFIFSESNGEISRSTLEVCNETEATVDYTLGRWAGENRWVTRGWWIVEAFECNEHDAEAGAMVYIAGHNTEEDLFWTGDKDLCVVTTRGFTNHKSDLMLCEDANDDDFVFRGHRKWTLEAGHNTFRFSKENADPRS